MVSAELNSWGYRVGALYKRVHYDSNAVSEHIICYCYSIKMGCCLAPMNRRPEDPSIVVYAPVTQLFSGPIFTIGPGLAYVEQDIFLYTDNWGRKIVNVNVKDIQSMSVKNAYVDSGSLIIPNSCGCSCAGCPDGVLDIRGKITQDRVRNEKITCHRFG